MTRFTVIECFKPPLDAVIVIVWVAVPFLPVATVKVEVEALGLVTVTGLGLNKQVPPWGHPVSVSVTLPLKVFTGVKVTLYEAVEPSFTVCDDGEAEIEKSGTTTTNVTAVVWVRVPSDPVTVKR
jgi:hypothetical protein